MRPESNISFSFKKFIYINYEEKYII